MSDDSVSVVIPVHDGAATIEAALRSALGQTRAPLEIVVVDDASRDSTREVVARVAAASPTPIHMVASDRNVGPGAARNLGWDRSRGDLVAFLDADDEWHPRKLEIQVAAMASNPGVVMSAHDRILGGATRWPDVDPGAVAWRDFGLRDFLVRNRCSTPSVVVRRGVARRFDAGLRLAEDYHLWLSIVAEHGVVRFADVPLVRCANPAYGGRGLSGDLGGMYRGELAAFRLLARDGLLPRRLLPVVVGWSTFKFVVRVVDRRVLGNRLQRYRRA